MLSPEQRQWASEELRRNGGDVNKVARDLGLSLGDLRLHFPTQAPVSRPIGTSYSRYKRDANGRIALGREELRGYAISARHVYYPWPQEDEGKLARAREDYDAGKVEMCQGREGAFIIQYVIPKLRPCAPREYFSYRGYEE